MFKSNSSQNGSVSTKKSTKQSQFELARRMVLWFCRDLAPFSLTESVGFTDFWKSQNMKETLPSLSNLSITALNDVYGMMKGLLAKKLSATSIHGTLTFDGYTDKYQRNSYMTYTYHTLTPDWKMQNVVLKTELFPDKKTGVNIADSIRETLDEFGIQNRLIKAITDGGRNMISACIALKLPRIGCVAHSIHTLIMKDLMENEAVADIVELFNKLRKTQTTLAYCFRDVVDQAEKEENKKLLELIVKISELGIYYYFFYI